jgi:hypothetical protein
MQHEFLAALRILAQPLEEVDALPARQPRIGNGVLGRKTVFL